MSNLGKQIQVIRVVQPDEDGIPPAVELPMPTGETEGDARARHDDEQQPADVTGARASVSDPRR